MKKGEAGGGQVTCSRSYNLCQILGRSQQFGFQTSSTTQPRPMAIRLSQKAALRDTAGLWAERTAEDGGEAGSLPAHFALESRPSTRTKESFGRSRLRPTPPATQRQGAWFRLRLRLRRAPLARLHCARALARGRTAARRGRGGLGLRPAGPRGCGIPTRLELGREGRRGGS